MIQKFLEIKIETNGQNLINISQEIEKFVENSRSEERRVGKES